VTLLTIDWHPWFSYEWWRDIGVPAAGAVGGIAVGAGAIAVAFHSNRIAQHSAQKEAQAEARQSRGEFGLLLGRWIEAEVRERLTDQADPEKALPAIRREVEIRSATVGQHSEELLATFADRFDRLGPGTDSQARKLAVLLLKFSKPTVRAWVADPESWWTQEKNDRKMLAGFEGFGKGSMTASTGLQNPNSEASLCHGLACTGCRFR
jgi:hypothetical protein